MATGVMESVRIGSTDYQIVIVDDLRDEGEKIDGQYNHTSSEIRLDADLGTQAERATLWHEILHGILVHAGYHGDHSEGEIAAIAYGVMQTLRDNPWLAQLCRDR